MEEIKGIHHVTAISGPAQENLDFYAGILGMRLVKKSVNQDDPGTYHLFYADAEGHREAGLTLKSFWRDAENQNLVFFVFEVGDIKKAKAFLSAADAKEHAKQAGVVGGEFHFVKSDRLY